MIKGLLLTGLLLLLSSTAVYAHSSPVTPADVWTSWTLNPLITSGLFITAWLYGRGLISLWHHAGVERGVKTWRVVCFAAGMLTLFVALISPLAALAHTLFSAHMVQHLLLMAVAPPLIVLGSPLYVLIWSIPLKWRWKLSRFQRARFVRAIGYCCRQPLLAWVLHTIALWLWHTPGLYELALTSEFFHAVEHAMFLWSGLLYWWLMTQPRHYGAHVLSLFATVIQSGLLGALLTFSPVPWYTVHTFYVDLWGLTALEDQQLAGLLMWIPMGTLYIVAAAVVFSLWLNTVSETKATAAASEVMIHETAS